MKDQTTVLPRAVLGLLRPLKLRVLHGVGRKMAHVLRDVGIHTVQDYLDASTPSSSGNHSATAGLSAALAKLDDAQRQFLELACRGVDPRPVKVDAGFRKSYSVEDSMVRLSRARFHLLLGVSMPVYDHTVMRIQLMYIWSFYWFCP